MLLTFILFASLNATAKTLTLSYPVAQIVWARFAFHVLVVAVVLGPRIPHVMVSGRLGLQVGRSLLMIVTSALFFTGLSFIPLAEASAIMFLTPILVTVFSVPLLGERVGPWRWAGVGAGLAGAIVIIRPGMGVMHLMALLPVCAAFGHAFYQISTRVLSRTDQPLTTLFYTPLVGFVVTTAVVPFLWVQPDLEGWLLMGLLGVFGGLGHFALIKSLTAAPVTIVAPFGYTNLIWATAYGYILFGDLPDGWTVLGAAVIVFSGLLIFYRETRSHKIPQGERPS
jgi:drug/metabolite transporter (DMT)-like permease